MWQCCLVALAVTYACCQDLHARWPCCIQELHGAAQAEKTRILDGFDKDDRSVDLQFQDHYHQRQIMAAVPVGNTYFDRPILLPKHDLQQKKASSIFCNLHVVRPPALPGIRVPVSRAILELFALMEALKI